MEHDPAPFASLESANSSDLQSMWNFFEKRKKNLYLPSVISAQCASCRCAKKLFEMFDSNCRWLPALHDFMHFCNNFMDDDHKILNYRVWENNIWSTYLCIRSLIIGLIMKQWHTSNHKSQILNSFESCFWP